VPIYSQMRLPDGIEVDAIRPLLCAAISWRFTMLFKSMWGTTWKRFL